MVRNAPALLIMLRGLLPQKLVDRRNFGLINPSLRVAANPSNLLPNPRLVSTTVHSHFDVPSGGTTLMTAMFGQFLDHDLTLTPEGEIEEHGECCTGAALRGDFEEPCFPVVLPRSDTFFQQVSQTQQVRI